MGTSINRFLASGIHRGGHVGLDACGCATSARFLAVGLVLSAVWYGWQWVSYSLSFRAVVLRVGLCSFGAATIGKIVGMLVFRWRSR